MANTSVIDISVRLGRRPQPLTPTAWHNVADPHAVAAIPQGGANDDPAVLTPRPRQLWRTMYILTSKHSILVTKS